MNDTRFELKVGLFVIVGAVLVALLILNFNKGVTFGKSTYTLHVIMPNAAGLKPSADVMMAGVSIGKVSKIELSDDARSVNISAYILSRQKIRKDAEFRIDSLGLLGDQYIEVSVPAGTGMTSANEADFLHDGDSVNGEATFNMLAAVQSISGVLDQARTTIKDLDRAVLNINASVLSTNSLERLSDAVTNIQVIAQKAASAATRTDDLLSNNAVTLTAAISNLQTMSISLTNTSAQLNEIVAGNRGDIHAVVTNLAVASEQFKQIALDVQAGKGPVGTLLKDEELKAEIVSIASNANNMAAEFSRFGSNLNQRGIWAMLWKPKHPESSKN